MVSKILAKSRMGSIRGGGGIWGNHVLSTWGSKSKLDLTKFGLP